MISGFRETKRQPIGKKPDIYKLTTPDKTDYPEMLRIWESSVRATHHFLTDKEIHVLKDIIVGKEVFSQVDLTCVRNRRNIIMGMMGVSAENLEMLFVHADFIGHGIGKILLLHAISQLHISKVVVNEQNEAAVKFYEHFGFKVTSKSETDEMGKPYPVLQMQLQESARS